MLRRGWLCAALLAGGISRADEPVPVPFGEFEEAQRSFRQWSEESLRQRQEIPAELKRVLYRKIEVPSPEVVRDSGETVRIPLQSPLTFLLPLPDATVGAQIRNPRIEVKGQVSGTLLLYERKVSVSCQSSRDGVVWAYARKDRDSLADWFERSLTSLQSGSPIRVGISGGALDAVSAKLRVGWVSTSVGWRPGEGSEGESFGALSAGPSTPEALAPLASLGFKASVEARGSVRMTDVQYGSPYGRRTMSGEISRGVVRLMTSRFECPRCGGDGRLDCERCGMALTIPCETCGAQGTVSCGRCGASGWVSCATTQGCGSCGGRGYLKCWSCSGSGTQYRAETETRWYREPQTVGFTDDGQPIVEYIDVPRTHTNRIPESCSVCGGSGGGGTCGTCGGSGTVDCRRCGGSGQATCGGCSGTGRADCRACKEGRVRCPACRGKPIVCAFCKGKGGWGPAAP